MGKLLREQTTWPEEPWIQLLQSASQSEIDTFVSVLKQNGLKIIVVEEYNQVLSLVDQSITTIEQLESCTKAQAEEIAALERRVKSLMKP